MIIFSISLMPAKLPCHLLYGFTTQESRLHAFDTGDETKSCWRNFPYSINMKNAKVCKASLVYLMGIYFPLPIKNIPDIDRANSTFIVFEADVSYRTYILYLINKNLILLKYSTSYNTQRPNSQYCLKTVYLCSSIVRYIAPS